MKLLIGVENKQYPDGTDLIDVARWNEYGTEMIPPRPAFRMGTERAIKNNQKLISAMLINFARDSLNKKGAGQKLLDNRIVNMLSTIGRSAVAETKKIIKSGETVGNAPSTIKSKGFDHPLYVDGTLMENISYGIDK